MLSESTTAWMLANDYTPEDINKVGQHGHSALMYASSVGKEDMVKLLLEFGADKNVENLDGFKAIDLAVTPTIYKILR